MNIFEILKNKLNIIYVKYLNIDKIEELPIFYIGGNQNLPPPLDAKEEALLLEKLANNDVEAKKTLVERNLYRCWNRRFNINWNNRINESNKHF